MINFQPLLFPPYHPLKFQVSAIEYTVPLFILSSYYLFILSVLLYTVNFIVVEIYTFQSEVKSTLKSFTFQWRKNDDRCTFILAPSALDKESMIHILRNSLKERKAFKPQIIFSLFIMKAFL